MDKSILTKTLDIKKGESISIEKSKTGNIMNCDIIHVSNLTLEIGEPVSQTGTAISLKVGEKVTLCYWSHDGSKYSFDSTIQTYKTNKNSYTLLMPEYLKHVGVRRWQRYKPVNMLSSFIITNSNGKSSNLTYIARVINISAGGMLISTAKRFNVNDEITLGFYAGRYFFTAIGKIKNLSISTMYSGEHETSIEFTNYNDSDKEFLEKNLKTLKL